MPQLESAKKTSHPPLQFQVRTLLLVATATSICLAVGVQAGWLWGGFAIMLCQSLAILGYGWYHAVMTRDREPHPMFYPVLISLVVMAVPGLMVAMLQALAELRHMPLLTLR